MAFNFTVKIEQNCSLINTECDWTSINKKPNMILAKKFWDQLKELPQDFLRSQNFKVKLI